MKALQAATLAAVPAESRNVLMISQEKNPLLVAHHETYDVTVSDHAFGQDFAMSVLYLNLPDTQLRFRTVARKSDFEKVHAAFRRSVFSWRWR